MLYSIVLRHDFIFCVIQYSLKTLRHDFLVSVIQYSLELILLFVLHTLETRLHSLLVETWPHTLYYTLETWIIVCIIYFWDMTLYFIWYALMTWCYCLYYTLQRHDFTNKQKCTQKLVSEFQSTFIYLNDNLRSVSFQMVQDPNQFDVLVMPNLYGDILR